MATQPITVLKFGSSVLARKRDLAAVVHEIYRELRAGSRVVAVVSALGTTTDALLESAQRIALEPEPDALALLLSTGESTAVALLALALERAGIQAAALDPARIGLVACGDALDADPVDVDVSAILRVLSERSVAVVPGFFGRDVQGRTRLFGRGGSDLSALFLASRLPGARCRLVKDVDGVWERDPRGSWSAADNLRYADLSFVDALRVGGRVVQPKALRFALEKNLAFEVASLGSPCDERGGTRVGRGPSRFAWPQAEPRALRVALLGLGTVGLGVYRELARDPSRFEVSSILVRKKHGRSAARVPRSLLTTEASPVLFDGCDVAIELLGGEEPSRSLVANALSRGLRVISANKALVCEHGVELAAIAAANGTDFAFSAAVGGALPVLESIRALRRHGEHGSVHSIEGVLNSTTNFVLDRLADGSSLEAAVALAHRRGFCEADPWIDLSGEDAAHKLVLAARAAFGNDVEIRWMEKQGIDRLLPEDVRAARVAGLAVRLVGSLVRVGERAEARLGPRIVDAADPLAGVRAEENFVRIESADGRSIVLRGKGAGRWPTTESVLGDLLEIARAEKPAAQVHAVGDAAPRPAPISVTGAAARGDGHAT